MEQESILCLIIVHIYTFIIIITIILNIVLFFKLKNQKMDAYVT